MLSADSYAIDDHVVLLITPRFAAPAPMRVQRRLYATPPLIRHAAIVARHDAMPCYAITCHAIRYMFF